LLPKILKYRSSRLEALNINKNYLRKQTNRIKQTIHKILNEDETLREKIKTLFSEQGITIGSILISLGAIIGVIIESLSGGIVIIKGNIPNIIPKIKGICLFT
jgi:prefoldin subunit 5